MVACRYGISLLVKSSLHLCRSLRCAQRERDIELNTKREARQ